MTKKERRRKDAQLIRRQRRRIKDLEMAFDFQRREISRLNSVIEDLSPSSHYADGM